MATPPRRDGRAVTAAAAAAAADAAPRVVGCSCGSKWQVPWAAAACCGAAWAPRRRDAAATPGPSAFATVSHLLLRHSTKCEPSQTACEGSTI